MPSEKFELTDINKCNSESVLTMGSEGKKEGGCYVSSVLGFILLLLAVLVAVGVGIIVHFAGGDREVVCKCDLGSGGPNSAASVQEQCMTLASSGNTGICEKCPSLLSTQIPPGGSTPTTVPRVTDVRLPTSVMPVHYDVELQPYMHHPDPKNFTFRGKVKIVVRCDEPTENVTLHTNVLEVIPSSIRFYGQTPLSSDPQYLKWQRDEEREFFILKLTKNMQRGRQYIVEMSFTSPLTNSLNGLYYSTYKRGNRDVYLATTQFQPTDARKAFPCFDEPAIKATFNITLVRPVNMTSISNMPIASYSTPFVEAGITYIKDVYQQTPNMSTYLLAFIVSDFTFKSGRTTNGVLYRTWATPESVNQTAYALDVGSRILTYFEDFFAIRYPLPKQDMIAIPDFAAGAMENWGLITYRETAMLYEDGVSNEANRERVAVVVSHELAHQWFGNLVSPSWWDDLWLNEGFATFIEYLGVDYVHPDWRMSEIFVVSEIQRAMAFDGLISSHPVYVPVAHPDGINEIFDDISYAKGASIIHMMRHFLGYDTFKKGLTRYLESLQYGSAFHDDLWSALTEQARMDRKSIDVKSIMDTWTLQMNYPVVMVERDFNDLGVIRVTQKRYLENPDAPDPGKFVSPFGYKWTVPLTFTSSRDQNFNKTDRDIHWLYKEETTKTFNLGASNLPGQSNTSWILANVDENGYYRVNYPEGNWLALSNQLKTNHQVFPVTNRAQMINDAWNLAKSGDLTLLIALKTIEYLDKERDYSPWLAASDELSYVNAMLSLTPVYGSFQRFMQEKISPSYLFYGMDNRGSSHVEIRARAALVSLACEYGIQSCLDSATNLYRQWMMNASRNPIDPNLKRTVYCSAINNGGFEEWSFAKERYLDATVASEKSSLLYAMACSKKPWILNSYLSLLLDENSPVRKQDTLSVISLVSGNTIGQPLVWNYFRANFDILQDRFGRSISSWSRAIKAVMSDFNTKFQLEEALALKASKEGKFGSGARAFDQAIEKILGNIKWTTKNYPVIENWLHSAGY